MRNTTYRVKEMKNDPRSAKNALVWCQVAAVVGILFFATGRSNAQQSAPSDVYVASQKFYVQKLAEDVKAKHPELVYLNLRTIPPGRTESFKVGSAPPSRGGKSDAGDLEAEHTGKPFIEPIKDAPQEFHILLPLREKSGKIIGNIAIRMKVATGKTSSDALKLAEKINKELQDRIPSKDKLFEPA
jgi:hypothetical protein